MIQKKYKILAAVAPLIVIIDQITKRLITDRFQLGESIGVIENLFNITYVRNTGAAFGILADAPPFIRVPFFLLVPVAALFVIGSLFKKLPEKSVILATALSLVIGGAIGNLIDRARLGFVVDFLDFHWKLEYHYPAFNVADSAICVGVVILVIDLMLKPEDQSHPLNTK